MMKCHKCTKKATVHLTEIVDGKVMEMHLCEDCARDQSQHMEQQFGLADLLAGLTDFGKGVSEIAVKSEGLKCSACGLTYEDFRKFGRFGCAQCYVAFKPQLKTLLKKIHGSSVHMGKKPAGLSTLLDPAVGALPAGIQAEPGAAAEAVASKPVTVEVLRTQLLEAIEAEDFELAATLRDRIHALEGR
jgi:protein arginine kinase activator